jgi:hypothetical protein
MPVELKIDKNIENFIKKNIKQSKSNGKIGWFKEDDKRPDGSSNSTILLTHIHGSLTKNIPIRDPIFNPFKKKSKEILAFFITQFKKYTSKQSKNNLSFDASMHGSIQDSSLYVRENVIRNEILTDGEGSWKPLKEQTIKRKKGNSKILVDSKYILNSLKMKIFK